MNQALSTSKRGQAADAPVGFLSATKAALFNKRGISFSLTESLGSVGLWLLGAAVVGVSVGAAITFGQDSGAKGTLDSVKSAQVLHQAKTGSFGSLEALSKGDDKSAAALTNDVDKIAINLSEDGQNYCAVSTSRSLFAPSYWITAVDGKVHETKPTGAGVTCPDPK